MTDDGEILAQNAAAGDGVYTDGEGRIVNDHPRTTKTLLLTSRRRPQLTPLYHHHANQAPSPILYEVIFAQHSLQPLPS